MTNTVNAINQWSPSIPIFTHVCKTTVKIKSALPEAWREYREQIAELRSDDDEDLGESWWGLWRVCRLSVSDRSSA